VIDMANGSDFPVLEYGNGDVPHVLDVYEDMRCSYCAALEHELGATIKDLSDRGTYRIAYHVANFLDRGNEHGGSTNSLAALGAAAEQGIDQFMAVRAAILDFRLENGSEGLADVDVIRGIVAQTQGVDFLAVSKAINEDRFRPWALEAGPAALASLRSAWAAAELPGRAGTPAAFLDGQSVEVLDDDGAPLSPAAFEANVRAALQSAETSRASSGR
jgi:hypothetical protein